MKVLIVDDSKAIFSMVSKMFKDEGHETFWAEDGQKACDFLQETKDIDIILLDWNMPVMDGMQFLKKYMQENIGNAPVMMMTTNNKPDHIKEALQEGASEYVMKPFTKEILFDKIDLVMD